MNKAIVIVALALSTGCASQRLCSTNIEIHNSCQTTIKTTLENYSNIDGKIENNFDTNPGESVNAGEIYGTSCDLNESLMKDYRVTLTINNTTINLDRSEIIAKLKANHEKSTTDSRYRLIDTTDYCQ